MKRLSIALAVMCAATAMCIGSVTEKSFLIHFATNQFQLTPEATAELASIVEWVNADNSYYEIYIEAHTDNEGTKKYNDTLSFQRYESVHDFLVTKGINENVIDAFWFGEIKPVQNNESEKGKQANRRAVIIVRKYLWNTIDDLVKDLSPAPQEVKIQADKPNHIITEKGIKLYIPQDAFVTTDGKQAGGEKVNLKITEALDKSSWLENGLTTVSSQGILESGGMFKIEAIQNGEKLQLKEGKKLDVEVPFQSFSEGMQLFYASADEGGNLVWNNTQQNVSATVNNTELSYLKIDTNTLFQKILKYSTLKSVVSDPYAEFMALKPMPTFKMSRPKPPLQPDKKKIAKQLSFSDKIFLSKKKREQMIEEKYEKQMEIYDKKYVLYEKRTKRYCDAYDVYASELKNYFDSAEQRKKIIAEAKKHLQKQFMEYYANGAYRQMHVVLSKLYLKQKEGKITDPNYISSLKNNYYGLNSPIVYDHMNGGIFANSNIKAMLTKFKSLGFDVKKIKKEFYFGPRDFTIAKSMAYQKVYEDDEELSLLFADAEQTLINERADLGLVNMSELAGYYTASLSNMEWINIDRFMKSQPMVTLNIDAYEKNKVYVVIDNINSVLNSWDGVIQVPKNMSVTIFGIALIDGKPHYAVQKIVPKINNQNVKLEYQQGMIKSIKDVIKLSV